MYAHIDIYARHLCYLFVVDHGDEPELRGSLPQDLNRFAIVPCEAPLLLQDTSVTPSYTTYAIVPCETPLLLHPPRRPKTQALSPTP